MTELDPIVAKYPGFTPSSLQERTYAGANGIAVLTASLVGLLVTGGLLVVGGVSGNPFAFAGAIVVGLVSLIALVGLVAVNPGQARVIQVLGRYAGTVRTEGLRWVNPISTRRPLSTRVRNLETAAAKVNDADGNPIEIAAVVVWRVRDTALASFGVENVNQFVGIQSETAVRHIATSYPYDAPEGQPSLRVHADDITAKLTAEIAARVVPAGVDILESRITRLSYASEIAGAMLRRQQASAVVAARARIVEGAVGMVKLALSGLAEQGIVDLDEERKAAMVSNLLVVLCGDRDTQPVVNTGSLYA